MDKAEALHIGANDVVRLAGGAVLLRGGALGAESGLIASLGRVQHRAPFRHMRTPGGGAMSVAITNCGLRGWISDRNGYRYERSDPITGQAWPKMPNAFRELAIELAGMAGYLDFEPDVCVIKKYAPEVRSALHQDDKGARGPIVSISLGMSATFQLGGPVHNSPPACHPLHHGDVVIRGGPSRLFYHGSSEPHGPPHPELGARRIDLCFG